MEAKRLRLLILFFAFSFVVLVFLTTNYVVSFPSEFPVETLSVELKISSFIEKVTLPIKIARLSSKQPDEDVLVPVYGTQLAQITDSWNSPRPEGRFHEGQDIFASRGTPVFAATEGYIVRVAVGKNGGNFIDIVGAGGRRYYYAHLDRFADGISIGQHVTTDTVLGFVGNSGNASTTPTHLHFGIYEFHEAIDPLPMMRDRKD